MEIRPATANDFGTIREVAHRSWDAAYADLLDDDVITDTVEDWYSNDTLSDALDEPGTVFLVATDGDRIVGFCHGVCQDDEGDVLRLYVDPDRWDEGVGTRLHERLRDDLLDFNMKRMRAIVLADNDRGNRFYRDLGFAKTGEGEVELGDRTYTENVYTLEFDGS